MWLVAFLGASTAYVESTLGQIYKVEYQGQYRGGPAFYFDKGLGQRWLGVVFAIAAIISCGLFLPGIQANAVGKAFTQITGEGAIIFGDIGLFKLVALVVIVGLLAIIIFGGIKRIARFAEFVVPFMAAGYILMAVVIVIANIHELPGVIKLILKMLFRLWRVLVQRSVGGKTWCLFKRSRARNRPSCCSCCRSSTPSSTRFCSSILNLCRYFICLLCYSFYDSNYRYV